MNELSLDASKLLRMARGAQPSQRDKSRNRARLLAAMGTASTAVATAAVAKEAAPMFSGMGAKVSLLAVAGKALLVGAGLGVGVAAVGGGLSSRQAPPALVATTRMPDPSRPVTRPRVPPRVLPEPFPTSDAAQATAPLARGTASACAAASIRGETELLAQAQRALGSGRAMQALVLLNRYDSEFPSGALREEAEGARVLAVCARDHAPQAQRAAIRFLQTYPRSPLIARIQTACDLTRP